MGTRKIMHELYKKYRPKTYGGVIGQTSAVATLEGFRGNYPHLILFTGQSGIGKTTLAKIVKDELGCTDHDFCELDCGQFRGIDTIRDIRQRIGIAPSMGKCRVWLLDECFPAGTFINTPKGKIPIELVKQGESVFNIDGIGTVKNTFINKIPLERVVKIHLSNGQSIITTKQHKFLTEQGWKEAKSLEGSCILSMFCNTMYSQPKTEVQSEKENVPVLQSPVCFQIKKPQTEMLLKVVCSKAEERRKGCGRERTKSVSILSRTLCSKNKFAEKILFDELCKETEYAGSGIQKEDLQQTSKREDKQSTQKAFCIRRRRQAKTNQIRKNERKQSNVKSREHRKSKSNKGRKRHITRLYGRTWREWEFHKATEQAVGVIGRRQSRLEKGTIYQNKKETPVPTQVCSRYWEQKEENRNRNRWERPFSEKGYLNRCKKDRMSSRIRVDHIEIYKQGDNEESFRGVIENREKDQGYVEFYDLEITGSPTYFAEGLPVHNCHKLSNDAQSAMLKMLEDTPKHAYFLLCTTHPTKIIPTIVSRATVITLKPVADKMLEALIKCVLDDEKARVSDDIIEKIVETAEGSPRKALVLLEQVYRLKTEEEQLEAISKADFKQEGISLARALFDKRSTWKDVSKILEKIEDEEEGIRRLVLAYASKVLLKGGPLSEKAFNVINAFRDHWFDCGKAGLIASCYEVMNK